MKKEYLNNLILIFACMVFFQVSIVAQSQVTVNLRAVTTAEADAANPDQLDQEHADIQVLKTDDGSADRVSFVKFDISSVKAEHLAFATFRTTGGQHNGEEELINPYIVEIYACEETDWSREDLTWNSSKDYTIGENPLATANMQGFAVYDFYSSALTDYIAAQKEAGAGYVAFKVVAKDVLPFDTWITGSWDGGASNLILSYSEPYAVIPSSTTAETDRTNPDEVDVVVDDGNDIQIWKTTDESEEREAYVQFDISEVSTEYLKDAVISCYGGQHNGEDDMIEANWVQMYACENTDWSRDDLTWNIAKDFTIGENVLASVNVQGFAVYEFKSPAIAQYIIERKKAGAESVAFKFVAKDVQPFDSWLSGAWEGMNLTLYQGDTNQEAIQDLQTADASAANPEQTDQVPNDIMVQLTQDRSGDYEGFVSFDISAIENPGLVYASIAFKAGQHAPEGEDVLDKYIVDLYPLKNTDWTVDDITWNSTRSFNYLTEPVASVNIWGGGDYYFTGEALAGYINSQLQEGATTVAFIMKGRDVTEWDAWLSGDWNGMHLSWADPSQALPPDDENPTTPGNLAATAGITSITLTWEAATDNRGVDGYKVYSGTELLSTLDAEQLSFAVSDLNSETEYSFDVTAFDKAGNESEKVSVTASTIAAAFDITIDAVLDEDWGKFDLWQIDNLLEDWTEPESEADCSGEFRLAWSPDGLYMFVEVFDDVRDTDAEEGYNRDHIEVNIDPQNNKPEASYESGQMQITFEPDPAADIRLFLNDVEEDPDIDITKIVYSFLEKNDSYIFEIMFPWAAIGTTPPSAGHIMGFDVTISDDDGSKRETVLAWNDSDDYDTWNNPADWGTLELLEGGKLALLDDPEAPTPVDQVIASVEGSNIVVKWTPSTDNIGVTAYNILNEEFEVLATTSDTSYTFEGLEAGQYYYTVVARDAAGNTSEINYDAVGSATISAIAGITKSDMTVFPCPAQDILFIHNSKPLSMISVFDLTGRKMISRNIKSDKVQLNISFLNSGTYVIKAVEKTGNVHVSKIVKE